MKARRTTVLVGIAGLVAAACGGAATTPPAAATTPPAAATTAAATASANTSGWPYTGKLKDGSTFKLADRLVAKLQAHQPINYVFSYQSAGIANFSQQYLQGYNSTLQSAAAIYPLTGKSVAPAAATADPSEQIAQIETLLNTNQIDCLSIEPATSDGFTAITNKAMSQGIPVFTVGVTSNGNELTNFTQVPMLEGAQAAHVVLDWMTANNKSLKVFAVSGGDPTQFWAQGRMKSFVQTIKAAIPDATFLNDETNGLTTTYDPAKTYDAYKAFITGHPTVQFIENVDIGAEFADRAAKDLGKSGQIFTIGWNVTFGQLDAIDSGAQVAALDQRWAEQAGFGATACATLFGQGQVLPNTQKLNPITKANSAAARADLTKILGTPAP